MTSLEYLRQFRIGQFTLFDTLTAYIGVLILSPILSWLASKLHIKISVVSWLWLTLPISVLFHIIFRQTTPLIKILADPRQVQFYVALFILIAMSYMGLRTIRKSSKN